MSTAEQMEYPVGGVPSEKIMLVWDRVEPILARVVKEETGHSLQSVLTALQMSQMQLWVVGDFNGVVVTSVEQRPLHKVLFINFLAGYELNGWLDAWIDVLEDYARFNECVAIEFNGRKGWNKIGERHPEYKSTHTVFRRELH